MWQDLHTYPDSKVHGINMGPTWVLSAPDGPRVGPMNLAIRVCVSLIPPLDDTFKHRYFVMTSWHEDPFPTSGPLWWESIGHQWILIMGLLQDTYWCGLRMRRECRERIPRRSGLAIPTCITARASRTFPAFPAHAQPAILCIGGPSVRDFDGTRHLTNGAFAGDFRRHDSDLTSLSYLRYSFCCQVLGCEDISIVLGSEKLHPDALPSSIRGINIVLNRDEDLSSCDENYEPCISLRWSVTHSCQDYQTYWLHWTTPELTNVTLGYGKIEALVLDLYVALWKRYDKTILDSAGSITFTNTQAATKTLVKNGSNNGLLLDGTKPLPEPPDGIKPFPGPVLSRVYWHHTSAISQKNHMVYWQNLFFNTEFPKMFIQIPEYGDLNDDRSSNSMDFFVV